MKSKHTITMNGQLYDAITGLPVEGSATDRSQRVISDIAPKKSVKPAHPRSSGPTASIKPQRSATLRRDAVTRPVGTHEARANRDTSARATVSRSPRISKFAPHPKPLTHSKAAVVTAPAPPAPPASLHHKPVTSLRQRKEKLINDKLATATSRAHETHSPQASLLSFTERPRTRHIVAACSALVLLGGYLTYINMPNVSVRVAAAQAGIRADFPSYHPDGYRFDGPIAYSSGQVTINFRSTTGDQAYAVKQQSSSWDSEAVLDNYVLKKKGGTSYIATSSQGLTVYSFGSNAAWVNGGILYTVEGNAPLSSDQVLRIVESM